VSDQNGAPDALAIFKERQGPASPELLARVKELNKRKAAIKKALVAGPMTVPEIAQAIDARPADVLWSLTAMRKYGLAAEHSVDGDYVRYALPEKEVKR
jgi:predicted transcriptional regulator